MTPSLLRSIAAVILLLASDPARATDATLEQIVTPRGAKVSFILIQPPHPTATVLLFAGGGGALGLKSPTSMSWGGQNFLVRSRQLFADANLSVAVVDAPSDQSGGMSAIFRMSAAHAGDIAAVAAFVRAKTNVPVWVVGTSMGTFSAAKGALAAKGIDGLVLTSTITRAEPRWKIAATYPDAVASMPLGNVRQPTLIVSHKQDACAITPAGDAPKLRSRLTGAAKVDVEIVDGGGPPGASDPCQALTYHGYLKIEARVVNLITTFIKTHHPK